MGEGGSFGELALMYNTPRAATLIAARASLLWALDRTTFRQIVTVASARKRALYETFLARVPLLDAMDRYERAKIADALESEMFMPDEPIVRQSEPGDKFYIIEAGEVVVTITADDTTREVGRLHSGDYFGELALLSSSARAATVTAADMVSCAVLDRDAFERLLGSAKQIMERKRHQYDAQRNSAFTNE